MLDDLFLQYRPQLLVLKRLHSRRSSANLDQLVTEICHLARKRRLRVLRLSLENMAQTLSPDKPVSKQFLFEQVVTAYPSLLRELHVEQAAKNPYHCRMLEAVALGMAYLLSV